ncbi:molybdenum cofactor guanylyltransferase MobA [Candidatus Halobeggiatoa sp. HSG11]|nr:molybdenum cofactor guanylyltransferase MobA [Candidatus Halobeggiatoa sp. HSG11]
MPEEYKNNITGAILAGGRAERMNGQDKGLLLFNNKCMIEHVINTLRPQVNNLIISANRNQERYYQLSKSPILTDDFGYYSGPLAGIATALAHASTDYVLSVPCDAPLISSKLAERLYADLIQHDAKVSVAHDGKRIQPTFCLMKCSLLTDLLAFIKMDERSVHRFLQRHSAIQVDFSDLANSFLNINTIEELSIHENK